ncbi:hypothetical protein CLAFUW4_14266 [Fulvia fulva]|uniref:Uncharacterized protein n=1 Tax=Passalora fulva TaxID=5499 RepID=A0A9Q8PN06_PASFU|nr:uncharacterized protein CLAFUR5_14099 [Fulvia fulva]KAK4609337.1 hypothetical protein CLAFUR4_14267 [Fulvia fulva]KAK4610031.1 hypothetical protein CLAFUR0_14271 [Fulvia fulva]UJO25402.1 hypothetical protein CLAFUR5_14099 [Fulvia fulva]WPV22939.1 hypothetical protein CLAFUW4_14266 [Fulvia fulva]WPV37569.1 hypothetical protein CLAFUW7_14275 [Fulvia fulva]
MATTTPYDALAVEVKRIASCPYPSQLRTLRDIVITQCSDADITQWAAANPCLVETLVSCLLEGLQQWPYVLDLVAKFASNPSCRDAFLRQEPTLLHGVVAQAAKQGPTKSKHTRASVALLSTPLPDTVALPAETQTLLMQLVENAAKKPSTTTIEPVHMLLRGTGKILFGTPNPNTLATFENHLIDILQKGAGSGDSCLSLYCLSIMNIARCSVDPDFRPTASSYSTQDFLASTPTSSRWRAEAMQQFFEGKKAEKSMQLIVLIAYSAIRGITTDNIKALVLANNIVTAVPADIRKNWCMSNATTIHKLHNQLCDQELDQTVRTLALRFVGKLCEIDSLPHPVLQGLERTFMEPRVAQIAHVLCSQPQDRDVFSGLLARASISDLLRKSVDFAAQDDSQNHAVGLDAISCIMRDTLAVLQDHKTSAHQIQELLGDEGFNHSLKRLHETLSSPQNVFAEKTSGGWCVKAMQRKRSNLAHTVSDLLLRASQRGKVASQTVSLLLKLHALSARGDLECNHDRPSYRDHFPVTEGNALLDSKDQIDWREALHTHFNARAQVEQDAVTRLFTKACASLEARCENVEKPLREEQERCRLLEEQNSDLNSAFAEMESRNLDLESRRRALEAERNGNVQELEDSRNANDALLDRVSRLEEKLREAHAQGKKQLAELNEAKQLAELDHATAFARKEEELDDLQEQLEEAAKEATAKARDTAVIQDDLINARAECNRLEDCISEKDAQTTEFETQINDLRRINEELHVANTQLQADLAAANSNLVHGTQEASELLRHIEELKSERVELVRSTSQQIAHLQGTIDAKQQQASDLAQTHQEAIETLEQQIAELHQSSQEKEDKYTTDLEARDVKITDLKKRVLRYQQKCEQKDQQIAEAEAMRSNLMAAMGLNKSQARTTLPHRSRESVAYDIPQTQEDPTPPTPASGNDGMNIEPQDHDQDMNGSFVSNASSQESKNGRTPKRPRPRRSIVVPATVTKTRASMGGPAKPSKTQQILAARRQTLGAVSTNKPSQRPVSFKTPTKSDVLGEDESTFDGSDLFAGTQAARMVEMGGGGDENA